MVHDGHTPQSYLQAEYEYQLRRSPHARKQIALLAIDLYHTEVRPEYRELTFEHVEHAPDAEKAITANVRKVHDLFAGARTVRIPFSFGHFIARAIDKLYGRDCVEQIVAIMTGPKTFAPGSNEAIASASKCFTKESGEAITGLVSLFANPDKLSEPEIVAQIKEIDDVLREGGKLRGALEIRLTGKEVV